LAIEDVVIIGAGPSGIAAAIQLRRYGIDPVVLEKNAVGGLLANANLVENYPGFPEGIGGAALVALFGKHLENAGVKVDFEEVFELEYENGHFITETTGRVIISNIAVIASGTRPRAPAGIRIDGAVCHRIFHELSPVLGARGKRIVIIGSGDAAFDYALNLSRENEVTILNRGKRTKCLPLLRERCGESGRITYMEDTNPEEICEKGGKLALRCAHGNGRERDAIHADHVVFAIGREPALSFLGSKLERSLEVLTRSGKLYMIGDVRNGPYRQVSVSVGDGVRAAMKIHGKMNETEMKPNVKCIM